MSSAMQVSEDDAVVPAPARVCTVEADEAVLVVQTSEVCGGAVSLFPWKLGSNSLCSLSEKVSIPM